jgi:hypothetical protein
MRRCGDVHTLPLESLAGADVKPTRPWLLVHDPAEGEGSNVLAYGTSRDTEAIEGATALDIRWRRLSGHFAESRFFTVRLRTEPAEEVPERIGYARDRSDDIRAALRQSLGIGTGVGSSPRPTIQRGQVVVLSAEVTEYLDGARTAVIVTEPRYSALRRHQLLLPVYSGEDDVAQPGEVECERPWVQSLPGAPTRIVIATTTILTHSEPGRPRRPGGIVGLTVARLDAATMENVDASLTAHLHL